MLSNNKKLKSLKINLISELLFNLFFFIFIILYLLLITKSRLLPFIDIPYQLAIATIYRYLGEIGNQFSEYFTLNSLLRPNILHMIITGSKLFPNVEFGNTIYYCIYIIIFPVAILALIKKIGGNKWFVFFSFFIIFSYGVSWGFVEHTMAIPLYCILIYFIIELFENRTVRNEIIVTFLLFFLTFTHMLIGLFAALIFVISFLLRDYNSFKKMGRNICIVLPTILIYFYYILKNTNHLWHSWYFSLGISHIYEVFLWEVFVKRLKALFVVDYIFRFQGKTDYFVALLSSLLIISVAAISFFSKNQLDRKIFIKKNLILVVSIIVSFVFYLFVPVSLPGLYFINSRFTIFLFIPLIVISSSLVPPKKIVWLIIPCILLGMGNYLLCFDYFKKFNFDNKSFNESLFPDHQNDKILTAILPGNKPLYMHFNNYYVVWKKGLAASTVYSVPYSKLKLKKPLPKYEEWFFKTKKVPSHYANSDFILFKGVAQDHIKKFFSENSFKMKSMIGFWSLYEKTL